MKKFIGMTILIVLITGLTQNINAQVTLNDNLAGAELVTALTVANPVSMHFGVIAVTSAGGSVTLNTSGNRTPGVGVSVVTSGTAAAAAVFDITGTPGDNYFFHLPDLITVTQTSGGNATMTINAFVTKVDTGSESTYNPGASHTLDSGNGKSQVTVGGTLNFGSNQPLGVYSGKYAVTVDYL